MRPLSLPKYLLNLLYAMMMCCGLQAHSALAEGISAEGERLLHLLDQTHVEERWLAGVHVAWETGEPDGKRVSAIGKHTHCSAFVAATAKSLGIYLLRPPEHGQVLLANAQYDWLTAQGQTQGWQKVLDGEQAQAFANRGAFVVAAYRNRHDNKPGHIAIVRPSSKSASELQTSGPQITQAGASNYLDATLKMGFSGHPRAWSRQEVRYFATPIDWSRVP